MSKITEKNSVESNNTCSPSLGRKILMASSFVAALGAGATAFASNGDAHKKSDCKYSSSPAELREKADRRVTRLARFVGLSQEQQKQLDPIVESAVDNYIAQRGEGRDIRTEAKALMMAGSTELDAYEPLRQDAIEWFDEASSIALDHALQAAEILTDEQRQDLADKAARRWSRTQ